MSLDGGIAQDVVLGLERSQVLVVATLVGFGLGSLGFWAYFRFRRPRTVPAPATALVGDSQQLVP